MVDLLVCNTEEEPESLVMKIVIHHGFYVLGLSYNGELIREDHALVAYYSGDQYHNRVIILTILTNFGWCDDNTEKKEHTFKGGVLV